MCSETQIELEDDYFIAPPPPNTWVDWLMLCASLLMACMAAYVATGADIKSLFELFYQYFTGKHLVLALADAY